MQNQSYSAPLAAYYMSECVPRCRAEINFTFLFSGNVSRPAFLFHIHCEKVWSQRKRVKTANSHYTPLHVHHASKIILIRCNTAEMSQNKTFLLASSHDCPDPGLCLQYYVFFVCSVHSRIPISSFSKCASITC